MLGCRPLSESELELMLSDRGRLSERDKLLLILGVQTGYRISELLSVVVRGVMGGALYVAKRQMKGQQQGRSVPLRSETQARIAAYVQAEGLRPDDYLFQSREGRNRPISRSQAWRILVAAAERCGLTGKIATHSLRKTFAHRVHKRLGSDVVKTQKALGHKNVNSTVAYLSVDSEEIAAAILSA